MNNYSKKVWYERENDGPGIPFMPCPYPGCEHVLWLNPGGEAGRAALNHLSHHGIIRPWFTGPRAPNWTCGCGERFTQKIEKSLAAQVIRHLIDTGDPAKHLEDFWIAEALG